MVAARQRVLILGGGFAGIGAARKLKGADVDVVLVDRHDYHTFQPLLYQVATDLLETTMVAHPLRDLVPRPAEPAGAPGDRGGIELDARQVRFDEMEPITLRPPRARTRRPGQLLRRRGRGRARLPAVHAADAVRLKEHILGRWEAADRDPGLVDDGALNVVVVGGGPTGVESAGALAELYRGEFAKDYPDVPQDRSGSSWSRPGRGLRDVQAGHPLLHQGGARRSAGSR